MENENNLVPAVCRSGLNHIIISRTSCMKKVTLQDSRLQSTVDGIGTTQMGNWEHREYWPAEWSNHYILQALLLLWEQPTELSITRLQHSLDSTNQPWNSILDLLEQFTVGLTTRWGQRAICWVSEGILTWESIDCNSYWLSINSRKESNEKQTSTFSRASALSQLLASCTADLSGKLPH